jgi:hypothetical protein
MRFSNSAVVSTILIALLVFLANPFYWWMPSELEYISVAALAVVATVFAALVMGEKARDEREVEIRARSARAGYVAGIYILTLSIAASVFTGDHASPWILTALGAMVMARFFVRVRSK